MGYIFKFVNSTMQEPGCHENYPTIVVIVSNLVSLMIYGIGAYILYKFSLIWVIWYVLFILLLEYRLLSRHCVDCYYYKKTCAFLERLCQFSIFSQRPAVAVQSKKDHAERYYP